MVFIVVLVVAFFLFLMFWYIIIPAIVLFVIWLWWTSKPEVPCSACHKKYRTKEGLSKHMQTCSAYQNYVYENNRRKQQEAKEERRRQEEERHRQHQSQNNKERWRKNWESQEKWKFTQEEFWFIQHDIDERKSNATKGLEEAKERATKKLWDELLETESESVEDRINDKIDEIDEEFDERIEEIEEEFEEEEQRLWDQVYDYDWYEMSDEQSKAKENYDKAKQDYKKSTGREWHDDDWEKNWKEAFEEILGHKINLDECYEELGLSRNAKFSEVKKRYRELALKHHPDKCKDKQAAEERFKKIVEAYEAIKNSQTMEAEA